MPISQGVDDDVKSLSFKSSVRDVYKAEGKIVA